MIADKNATKNEMNIFESFSRSVSSSNADFVRIAIMAMMDVAKELSINAFINVVDLNPFPVMGIFVHLPMDSSTPCDTLFLKQSIYFICIN